MAKKKTSSTKTEELTGSTGEVREFLPQAKDPVEAKLDLLIDLVKEMTKRIPFQGLDLSRYRFKD
jgi:hypothetical protein